MKDEEIVKKLIKATRKDLGIPENLSDKLYVLAKSKYAYSTSNIAFITQDSSGNIIELFRNPGPFVPGQLLYSPAKRAISSNNSPSISAKPKKSVKVKQLKPCPPGKIRNPVTGRCANEVKKSKK